MKLAIVAGSQRPGSQSKRVADYIAARLAADETVETYVLDLGGAPLPPWDPSIWSGEPSPLKEAWGPISAELAEADGFVIISPEWHGMVPPMLKNFLLLCMGETQHKPGLIVAVSASAGGAYPVTELRISGYKNNRLCWIPDHVILRGVKELLGDGDPASDQDGEARDRLDHSLALLKEYAKALGAVRASGVFDPKRFPFGM